MTDGRTGRRAGCWSVTAFNDEIELIQDKNKWPPFVKSLAGGLEKGKEGTLHFQGCLKLYTTQRLSALKKWLPTAHLEPAKAPEKLHAYAMKLDTAVGEKVVIGDQSPDRIYRHQDTILAMLADIAVLTFQTARTHHEYIYSWMQYDEDNDPIPDRRFRQLFYKLIEQDHTLVDKYEARIRTAWVDFHPIFIKRSFSALSSGQKVSVTLLPASPPHGDEQLIAEDLVEDIMEEIENLDSDKESVP